mmetsp:Transcript_8334/g.12422  ORF Transcript_8334/g.12422 Transcript_8334/m.12422 type:complete len:524 (-) Transcript_8334:1703-3274(-)
MEEELSRQFGKLSATGETDSRDDLHSDEFESQHDVTESDPAGKCNLIVNYLPHDIDDPSLKNLFAEFGEIVMTKVVRDKNTKKSLGYGFVKFLKEEDAAQAIDKMNGLSLGHKNLKVSVARPPSLEIRNCKLYVTNLPKEYSERDVVLLFKQFGEIIECRVLKDRNSRSNKGVAFVQFNLKSQANSALSLNGCQLEGSNRGLVVKYAEDQHKKKELSRLHSLTTSNPYRGSMVGMGGQGLSMGMSMGPPKGLRDPKGHLSLSLGQDLQQQQQAYYFPQQQAMYGGPPSPITMMHAPMSPLSPGPPLSMYQMQMPPQPDYGGVGGGSKRPGGGTSSGVPRGRKSVPFPLDIPSGGDPQASPNWFGSLQSSMPLNSMHLPPPYLQSPVSHHHMQQQHMNLALMSPSSQTSTQSSHSHQMRPPPRHHSLALHSPSASYSSSSVTLTVHNLPAQADNSLLHELFSPYGKILSANVDLDRQGGRQVCTGRGRVVMSGFSQAEYAAQALNGALLYDGGLPLHVSISFNG